MTRVVICCGAGGVGKTTLSAALAVRLASEGYRVAALTIDPARRLADSLGLQGIGNEPRDVPIPPAAGRDPMKGQLHVMMLDAKTTFDKLVLGWAPSAQAAQSILENRYYRYMSSQLGGSQEYMAMVRLLDLVDSGRYEFIVLDTPPTQQALDFLSAPSRVARVMDHRVLHMLALPQTRAGLTALYQRGATAIRVLNRLVGLNPVQDVAEFIAAFEGMTEKFRIRSLEMQAFLRSPATLFTVVTTPNTTGIRELQDFHTLIKKRGFSFLGFLVNRYTPPPRWSISSLPEAANNPVRHSGDPLLATLLFSRLSARDDDDLREMKKHFPADERFWLVPTMDSNIHTMQGLTELGEHLPISELLSSLR